VLAAAYDQLLGLGPLGPLWRDADITDIMVTGPNKVIVDKNGFLYRTNVHFTSAAALLETGRRLSTRVDDRAVSRSNPLVTVQLDKARVQLAWPPIARSGGNITIRKHRRRLSLPELLDRQALSPAMAALISDAVISQAALLVSGGTGTGKTTYLNIASGFIPDTERVIVIEDAAELDLTNSFVEYYLTKQRASADDQVTIEFKQILQSVLRMRPDRIIVGEILTAEGAEAMLTASYTGHDGTMSTIHANNPHEALARLADLAREATGAPDELTRKKVAGTFDLLIHVDKNKQTGVRFVSEIATVNDDGTTETIFSGAVSVTVDPDTGTATGTPVFTKVGALRADTSIAIRMRESGIDTGPWERTS
jgi:pilus assembly protein CpaF